MPDGDMPSFVVINHQISIKKTFVYICLRLKECLDFSATAIQWFCLGLKYIICLGLKDRISKKLKAELCAEVALVKGNWYDRILNF